MRPINGGNWKVTSWLQDPSPFTSSCLPLTGMMTISYSSSQFTFSEGRCDFAKEWLPRVPFRTCEHKIRSHMGLGSDFSRVVGWGRSDDVLQAALVLSLQGVAKVRESQMSIEHQALPTPGNICSGNLTSLCLVRSPLWASRAMWSELLEIFHLCYIYVESDSVFYTSSLCQVSSLYSYKSEVSPGSWEKAWTTRLYQH